MPLKRALAPKPDAIVRILIATHAALNEKYGAAQIALNLADALRKKGSDVEVWSPQPIPASVRSWRHFPYMRRALLSHLETGRPFDVLDAPAFLIPPGVDSALRVIARSVQPDLRYLWCDATAGPGLRRIAPRRVIDGIFGLLSCGRIFAGWSRADAILCLGTDELRWMGKRFPWWCTKLSSYFSAPAMGDRITLAELRKGRRAGSGRKYLWIGRWVCHKGIDELLKFIQTVSRVEPDSIFTIAGCGNDALRALPQALLKAGRVRVIAEFDRGRLMELLREHDIGLFTSVVEGWGLSLQEMLEAGLTVYATATGAAVDLAPHFEKQLLPFPPRDSARAAPQELSIRYVKDFSWDGIAAGYLALASRLVSAGRN